jgi:hypothetical protein
MKSVAVQVRLPHLDVDCDCMWESVYYNIEIKLARIARLRDPIRFGLEEIFEKYE